MTTVQIRRNHLLASGGFRPLEQKLERWEFAAQTPSGPSRTGVVSPASQAVEVETKL